MEACVFGAYASIFERDASRFEAVDYSIKVVQVVPVAKIGDARRTESILVPHGSGYIEISPFALFVGSSTEILLQDMGVLQHELTRDKISRLIELR